MRSFFAGRMRWNGAHTKGEFTPRESNGNRVANPDFATGSGFLSVHGNSTRIACLLCKRAT
jgi:hypothetical protein